MSSVQVNCVELALSGALAAADALNFVNYGSTAGQAAAGLDLNLIFGKALLVLFEVHSLGRIRSESRKLSLRSIVRVNRDVVLIEFEEMSVVSAKSQGVAGRTYETMDGLCCLMAFADGINYEGRTMIEVAAYEDVVSSGLIGEAVSLRIVAVYELDVLAIDKSAPLDALTNGLNDEICVNGHGIVLIILRVEPTVLITNAGALLEDYALNITLVVLNELLRAPAIVDGDILSEGLLNFFIRSRHFLSGLQADHGDFFTAETSRCTSGVNSYVTTADNNDFLRNLVVLVAVYFCKMINSGDDSSCVFVRNVCFSGALKTDSKVECLVALVTEFLNGYVLTNFNAALNLNAEFADNIDFSGNNVFLKFVRRNAVNHHAARLVMFFKDGRLVTHGSQVVGTGKTCRAGTDDSDLLAPLLNLVGLNGNFRNITGLLEEIALSDELLNLVDGNCLVDSTTGAGFLALTVADTSADSRERVLFLDEGKSVIVTTLFSHLKVALNSDVSRAGRFTRSSTGLPGLLTLMVTIVRIPSGLEPDMLSRIFHEVVGLLRTIFEFEFLTKTNSANRAVLYAATAGNAVVRVNMGTVCRSRHCRSVEQLRGTDTVADLRVTVADSEDLVLAVDIGNLVYIAVLLGLIQDSVNFFFRNIVARFLGLYAVICEVANTDTPMVRVVGAALAALMTLKSAGTWTYGELVVLVNPIGKVILVNGAVIMLNSLFNRDNVHSGTSTAVRDHLGQTHRADALERKIGGKVEPLGDFRMVTIPLRMLVEHLSHAWYKCLDFITFDVVGLLTVELADTVEAHLFKDILNMKLLFRSLGAHEVADLVESFRFSLFHLEGDSRHLRGSSSGNTVIVRAVTVDFLKHTIGTHLGHLQNILVRIICAVISNTVRNSFPPRIGIFFLFLLVCHRIFLP